MTENDEEKGKAGPMSGMKTTTRWRRKLWVANEWKRTTDGGMKHLCWPVGWGGVASAKAKGGNPGCACFVYVRLVKLGLASRKSGSKVKTN